MPPSQVGDFITVKTFINDLAPFASVSIHGLRIAGPNGHLSAGSFFDQLDAASIFVVTVRYEDPLCFGLPKVSRQ